MIFGHTPSRFRRGTIGTGTHAAGTSPRRKLTLVTLALAIAVIASPFATPEGGLIETATGNDGLLPIDSPTLALDTVATTEDGFMIKSAGQTTTADRSQFADVIAYTVESGDSLSSIAHRFGVSMETVIWENNIDNPSKLKLGTTLRILPVSGISHTATAGDTLATIAKKYGIDATKIARQNNIADGATLLAGQTLIIPDGKKIISLPASRYIARAGTYAAYSTKGGRYTPSAKLDGAVVINDTPKGGKWMEKPTNGIYTTRFQPGHYAVDIANRAAPAIHAAAAGTVIKSQCGWNGGYGCMIVIDHGNGMQTLYAHMNRLGATVGEKIGKGEEIGMMGHTGRVRGATGIHLHFEVVDHGRKRNPIAYYAE